MREDGHVRNLAILVVVDVNPAGKREILGVLLMISCFGYLINSVAIFLGYNVNTGLFGAVGEILFILWLLIKGVNAEQWKKRALESA